MCGTFSIDWDLPFNLLVSSHPFPLKDDGELADHVHPTVSGLSHTPLCWRGTKDSRNATSKNGKEMLIKIMINLELFSLLKQ